MEKRGLSVEWSVGLSVTTMSPAEMAEPIEMPFGCGLRWIKENVLGGGPDPPREGVLFRGMTLGFYHTLLITIPSGSDVGISPHALNQSAAFMYVEALK